MLAMAKTPSIKTSIDIERLLQWTYRDELPKQAIGGLTGWERLIFLGTRVDTSHQETNFPAAMGAAHPDALLVDSIVRHRLPVRVKLEWPRGRDELMGDLGCWILDDNLDVAHMQAEPIGLVIAHARMGTRPGWGQEPVRFSRILGKNGKPVVSGISAGRRYSVGAYCPLRMDPAPQGILSARFQYRVWHAALTALSSESWILEDHAPKPPVAASYPWRQDDERRPVIHWVIGNSNGRVVPLKRRLAESCGNVLP